MNRRDTHALRRATRTRTAGLALALAGCAALASACHADSGARQWPKRVATPGKATLPPTPNLAPKPPPSRHDDGAWTVHGLREAGLDGTRGIQTVKGHVIRLHTCPTDAKRCEPAPFAQIADSRDGVGERLLLGGERGLVDRGWKEGDLVTVGGLYVRNSPDGVYFSQRGMLLLAPPKKPQPSEPTATDDAPKATDEAEGGAR